VSTGFDDLPDGRVRCVYMIANNCKGYVAREDLYTYPGDKHPAHVCKPCGELDWQRYVTEHYG
jgi:hypothetical protein